jgi:hypothetical protein
VHWLRVVALQVQQNQRNTAWASYTNIMYQLHVMALQVQQNHRNTAWASYTDIVQWLRFSFS